MNGAKNRGVLGTLFRFEIKMLLRDTRTILITIVAPLVILPAYILILRFVESRDKQALEQETYTYAVIGTEAEWAAELVLAAIARDSADPDTSRAPARFEKRSPRNPLELLAAGDLHMVVQGLSAAEWESVSAGRSAAQADSVDREAAERQPPVPAVRIHFRAESDFSREARNRLTERIREVRAAQRDSVYRAAGFPVGMAEVARVDEASVATAAKEAGALLGLALTPVLVLLMLSGGSIVAVDTISGEKERGTLETLLTTAAGRTDIIRAKMLAVVAVGLTVAVINVANLLLYLVIGLLDLPADFAVEIGAAELLLLLLLFVPVTLLVASALLLLSGASKSYKEFQVYFFPLFLAFLVPTFAASLPGIELRSAISLVPLAGIAVATREILIGETDLPFIAVAFLSTGGLAAWLTRLAQQTLSNEKLISGSDLDAADLAGGAALFPRHVLRLFLGIWVVFFVVSLWFGQDLGLMGQVAVNVVVIFFGGCLIIIRRYGLKPAQAFGLRLPHPAAWLAVVVGAPSALVLAVGLGQLVDRYVFPVPEGMMESFGRALTGPDLPLWQIVFFLTVLPGVFEELTFRGVLLHGLKQRIRRRWLLAVAVGAIFGFFHVSLFRIVPTALLGFVLTYVVLLSGSIFPAMLWHTLNNSIGILPARLELLPEDFVPSAWWTVPAAVGLAVSMWILWRSGPERRARSARLERPAG